MVLAADWTAIGTFTLALVTAGLAWTAWMQIAIQRKRMEEATRPHVFPAPSDPEWGDAEKRQWRSVLPVTNGGPGVALNVTAQLRWGQRGLVGETVPTSLAPGESRDLVIRWQADVRDAWHQLAGALYYDDVSGARWETEFRVYEEGRHHLVEVKGTGMIKRADGTVVQ